MFFFLNIKNYISLLADEREAYWKNVNAIFANSLPFLQSVSLKESEFDRSFMQTDFDRSAAAHLNYPLKISISPYFHQLISAQGKPSLCKIVEEYY